MNMTFGDIAHTNKGLPSIPRGTEVQVTGVGIHRGTLCYTVAIFDSMGNFNDIVGPYPAHAFTFGRLPTPAEQQALIKLVNKNQGAPQV